MEKIKINSPLIEAVCEIQFSNQPNWDTAIPDKLYDRLKDQFPIRSKRIKRECEGIDEEGDSVKIKKTEYELFIQENKKIEVLIDHYGTIIIRVLKPYPSWDTFKSIIGFTLSNLSEIINIENVSKIRLYYYNIVDTKLPEVKLENYFRFKPFINKDLPQTICDFIVGCEYPFDEKSVICRTVVTMISDDKDSSNNIKYSFSIDYKTNIESPIKYDFEQLLDWMERGHNRIESVFYGSISKRYKNKILGG